MLNYKGYVGHVMFDPDKSLLHGTVVNTRDVITFESRTTKGVKKAFQNSVDDYLEFCRSRGESPDKPYSGHFITRISPELHRDVSIAAKVAGKSLNAWVAEQLTIAVKT